MIRYALSIRQPWAYYVCSGFKAIENRDFAPRCIAPGNRLLIHAGLANPHKTLSLSMGAQEENLLFGGIIGSVEYAGLTSFEKAHGQKIWIDTCYKKHWALRRPKKLPYFPCNGRQGLFKIDYPDALLEAQA